MMNANEVVQMESRLDLVRERFRAALVASGVGSPLCDRMNCVLSTAWQLIAQGANWREVLKSHIFWVTGPDARLAVIPLTLSESTKEGSITYISLRDICAGLFGENELSSNYRAFTFMTGLMVGYTLHRRAELADERWLRDSLYKYCPDVTEKVCGEEVARLHPFFEKPDQYVQLEDKMDTAIVNTLVAIHTLKLRKEWCADQNYHSATLVADRLYLASLRRFSVS
jgi:hypothetical protein